MDSVERHGYPTLSVVFALALMTGFAGAPALAMPQRETPKFEEGRDLTAQGWTSVTDRDDTTVYMRRILASSSAPALAWTLYDLGAEREHDGFTFKSVASLSEFDCAKRRSRVITETFFAGSAGQGKAFKHEEPTDWLDHSDGSVGYSKLMFVCPAPKAP